MKPYQQHDTIADKGKASPKPKQPTTRGRYKQPTAKSSDGAKKRSASGDKCCLGGCRVTI